MPLVIILLIIIAIGVLLMSELGQVFLAFLIHWGVVLGGIALVLFILLLGYGWYNTWEEETANLVWSAIFWLIIIAVTPFIIKQWRADTVRLKEKNLSSKGGPGLYIAGIACAFAFFMVCLGLFLNF